MNELHGPLNAALAADTAKSTSKEEAASTVPRGRKVVGDVIVIREGGWVREDMKLPFMKALDSSLGTLLVVIVETV